MKKIQKILTFILVGMVSLTMMTACQDEVKIMTDREGNEFTAPQKIERILSTAPSNTEVLVGLGLSDKLVGIDKYSTDVEGINENIETIDFRNPDAEAIIAMNPDIIIASGHNKEGNEDPYALLKEAGITVVYIPSANSIEGIYEDIEFIASVTDTEAAGQKLIQEMKTQIEEIKAIADRITEKKSVYFEIGSMPNLFSFGHSTFLNELITTVGATNILNSEEGWISPSEEAVISANPDVILTNEAYLENAVEAIATRQGFENTTAVVNGEIYLIDQNASSRGSQHVIKALKQIAEAIYPDYYAQ